MNSLTDAQRRAAIEAVRSQMAPALNFSEYARAIGAFHDFYVDQPPRKVFAERPEDGAAQDAIASNADAFERYGYRYEGIEETEALCAARTPLCFLTWHHGARSHLMYGLARRIPALKAFTRRCVQFGSLFTYSTASLGPLTLIKMRAVLNSGEPMAYYIDGAPLGETLTTPMLGYPSRISTAPFKLFARTPNLQLVPVSSLVSAQNEISLVFHKPIAASECATRGTRVVIDRALACLTDFLRTRAPAQVLPRYLPYRERERD